MSWVRSSLVERFSDKEEVEGSIPSAPTRSFGHKLYSLEKIEFSFLSDGISAPPCS